MADIKVDLRGLEKGLKCIEEAQKNGLLVVPRGTELSVRRELEVTDYDEEREIRTRKMLRENKEAVLSVTADPERLRQTLSDAQERMVEANRWLLTHMDLWDRLEKAYRTLFPGAEVCVRGTTCLDDAVVRCKACEGGTNGK